jgi:hypothetical protein
MSSGESPPTYYFSGITFNPDFYSSSSSSSTYITKITGKKYFLTYPSAQGTETISTLYSSKIDSSSGSTAFNFLESQTANLNIGENTTGTAGQIIKIGAPALTTVKLGALSITESTIDTLASSTAFNFLGSQTANLNIGENTSGTAGQIIQIGAPALTTVKCGALAIKERAINNATNATAGNIYIGDQQTSGSIYIGTGSNIVRTGNIGIGNYSTSSGTITVGTSAVTTNINGKGSIYATVFGIHDTTAVLKIGDTQTTGSLDIGSGGSRSGTGAINIGTGSSAAFQINIGSSSSTTTLAGTSVSISTKLITPKIEASDITVGLDIGSNVTSGNITIGAVMTNGDITIGNIASTSGGNIMIGKNATADIFIGNGTNNTTGINNGICYINKLQVGSVATAAGNGIGTGTPFRLVILGSVAGGSGNGTVSIPGAPTSGSNPIVFAQVNVSNTTTPYSINISPASVSTFNWAKLYWTGAGFANPTAEGFNYIAIWL